MLLIVGDSSVIIVLWQLCGTELSVGFSNCAWRPPLAGDIRLRALGIAICLVAVIYATSAAACMSCSALTRTSFQITVAGTGQGMAVFPN